MRDLHKVRDELERRARPLTMLAMMYLTFGDGRMSRRGYQVRGGGATNMNKPDRTADPFEVNL